MRAWTTTVGWPSWRGPLKRVSGELVGTGPEGRPTSASSLPVPTIAPLQIGRASSTLAAAIRSGAQVGRPRDVEAAVAVEVEDDLFAAPAARRRPAWLISSAAGEFDRREAVGRAGRGAGRRRSVRAAVRSFRRVAARPPRRREAAPAARSDEQQREGAPQPWCGMARSAATAGGCRRRRSVCRRPGGGRRSIRLRRSRPSGRGACRCGRRRLRRGSRRRRRRRSAAVRFRPGSRSGRGGSFRS